MSKAFLGRGWKFPIRLDPTTGRIRMSEYEEDIEESIKLILRTSPGERVMRSDFGCALERYTFGTPDRTTLHLIETSIVEAIRRWEARVTDVEVTARLDTDHTERLLLSIRYTVRTTNNLFNLVYPFYLYEGTK